MCMRDRHLMKAKEFLGYTTASVHNLAFYLWLMGEVRNHIQTGDFSTWKNDMVEVFKTQPEKVALHLYVELC